MAQEEQTTQVSSAAVAETNPPGNSVAADTGSIPPEGQPPEAKAESSPSQPPSPVEASSQSDPTPAPVPDGHEATGLQPPPPAKSPHTGTTAEETEAALDRIDADLADLESLLAQTSADGSTLPDKLTQAPPPAPEAVQAPELPADETTATTSETITDSAADETVSVDNSTDQQNEDANEAADLFENDSGGPVPDLSDGTEDPPKSQTASAGPAGVPLAAAEVAAAHPDDDPAVTFEHVLISIIMMPLFLIDKPFTRLGSRAKSLIGLAGIATFLVALATWIIGSLR